jgi:hypothetical protein
LNPNQATPTRNRPVSRSAVRSKAAFHADGTHPDAKVGTMWAPVAVAMPMPAKLPMTRAKIDSFCEAKMPVAPGSMPMKRRNGPRSSRPRTSRIRMPAMNPKQRTATQHSPRCQASTMRRAAGGASDNHAGRCGSLCRIGIQTRWRTRDRFCCASRSLGRKPLQPCRTASARASNRCCSRCCRSPQSMRGSALTLRCRQYRSLSRNWVKFMGRCAGEPAPPALSAAGALWGCRARTYGEHALMPSSIAFQ